LTNTRREKYRRQNEKQQHRSKKTKDEFKVNELTNTPREKYRRQNEKQQHRSKKTKDEFKATVHSIKYEAETPRNGDEKAAQHSTLKRNWRTQDESQQYRHLTI
jgi:hypothetical protein